MLSAKMSRIKRFGNRAFRVMLCVMMVLQTLWVPNSALAAGTAFYFRGYGAENMNSTTLNYATNGASVSGTNVTMAALAAEGEAIGLVNLNETDHDISKSVDLGGLEIDFSTVSNVTEEGTAGAENDVPTATIKFCSGPDIGSMISSVTLTKADNAVAGSETLSSGAKIPSGTRSIFVSLKGNSATGNNTVTFTNTSLVIHDAGAPSCTADYNASWTNQNVVVTISAADSDAGLEGIYVNDGRVSETSPYTFTISDNNTSFTAYALDLAGKKSDVISGTVDHIDKTTPTAPSSVPLSSSTWSNTDVFVLMPALSAASGAPERYVYQIGASAWTDLPDGFAITAEGNTTIRVAVADAAGNRSSSAEATAKIDKSKPTISNATITSGSSSAKVDVTATDVGLSGIEKFLYAAGEQTAEYFTTGGTPISGGSFTVGVGGTYTIFASDYAGNTALKTVSITTAPTFDAVGDVTMEEDETKNIPLTISDAESSRSELTILVTTDNDALLKTVVLNQTNEAISLDITPASNQSGGPVVVTVSVEDPSGQKVTRQFNVTVQAKNDPPVAQDDSATLSEDSVSEIDVLANDNDLADGDTLSIDTVGDAAHGTTLIVLGKIRYTPNENFAGTDSFTYTVTDGKGGTAQATVRVSVTQVNDAPSAIDDSITTAEDTAVTVDVLGNDTDVDTDTNTEEAISLFSCANGAHGTATLKDGLIEYKPEANFNGTDTFLYTIQDAAGLKSDATVTVTVTPQADAPWFVGVADEYTMDEDAKNHEIAFEIHDVETPQDSLMLQAASLDGDLLDQSGITISGLGGSSASVQLLLTPQANMFGDVQIKLTLGDGFETVEKTITVHILNVNDAPRAGSDTLSFTEDVAYFDISIADLLSNDTDIDHDAIFFDGLESDPSSGTIQLLDETTLRYTPVKDFDGTTSFTYSISDGKASTLVTCTLKAIGVNDAPSIVVTPTQIAGTEDTMIVIPFEILDNESAAADLSVIVASSDDSIVTNDGVTVINNGGGTGEVRILPEADANGPVSVTLIVSDGEAQASDAVTLNFAPTQDAPIAEDDLIYVRYTTSRNFSVLVNDHDVDGDTIRVKEYAATLPGTLTFDADTQTFNYVPAIGEVDIVTFDYTITDGTDTDTAIATLDVVSETHNPVITPIDSQYVSEDGTASGIAFGVSDEDVGDTASIQVTSGNKTLLPEGDGHITVNDLGSGNYSLTLIPAADQSGVVSVTVKVTDSSNLTDSTTFSLYVIAQNDPPVAVNDTRSVNEDTALLLSLLTNDSDPDGDTIWLSSISKPAHGYIERTGNNYTYYPYDNWNGSETLTYQISDGRATASASVSITVNPVNDTPVAWPDWYELPNTTGTESATISVLANDYDNDGDTVHAYRIETAPKYGTAVIQPNGNIVYTRNQISPLSNGADSFEYSIIDRETATGDYLTSTTTVYIGVDFISTLNTYGRSVYCFEDDAAFNIDLSVSNPTPVNYNLTVDTTTTLGTFDVVDHNTVRFTPAPDQYGTATITYTVEQVGGGEKDTGTIWLRVYPVNDLPEITSAPTSVTMDEDTSAGVSFDVLYHDVDCSNDYLYFYVYTKNGSTTAPIPFMVSYSSATIDGGRRVTVTTAENVNGTGTIVVGVSDGMTYVEKEVALTVNPVDDAPGVVTVSKTINEDSSVVFASPGSDSEVDGDTIVEAIDPARPPQHGTATFRSNHTIYYVPDANYNGTDEFYVIVTDQTTAGLNTAAKVSITVRPINDPPEIYDLDYYQTTPEDEPKDVTLTVSDVDNILTESSHYTLTSDNQSLVKNENISISHGTGEGMVIHVIPEPNAYGTVKIKIVANDGALNATGAFQLKIVAVNDLPEANDDTASVDEVVSTGDEATPPKTLKTIDLLVNDSDVEDGKPSIVSITNMVNATVTNIGGGKVLVSADGDFSGTVTFTYTVMDRAGATASADVTLTVNAVNDPPRAKDDSITIQEDATPTIDALSNDSDPESDPLVISDVADPAHGTATVEDNKISYVPDQDYFGKDTFLYTVSDGKGGTATASITVTIKPVNDAPTIAKHSSNSGDWMLPEDTTGAFHFVVADAESATSNLIIKITSLDETLVKTAQIALTTNVAGYKTLTLTPVANAHDTVNLKVTVSDGLLSTEAIWPLLITSVNDAPVVTVPVQTTKEDTALHATAFATDADGDSVTFAKSTDPSHGTVTVYPDGSFDYMPAKDYNGEDSFVILANDGQESNNIGYATVHITVKPDGDPPTAQDDTITIDEDIATPIPVLDNDSDEDVIYGDKISLLSVTKPAHGTAVIQDGAILYTPAENYNGTDSFGYTITDLDGKTDTATVNITIRPVNDKPSGGDDTATVLEDHSVVIEATLNDDIDETTNPDLEDVTILTVDTPAHGTASVSTDKKSITYTPNANWFSPDGAPEVFYYTAKDSSNQTERFAISVTVTSVNDLPVIAPDLTDVTTPEDTRTNAITFTVSDIETAAGSLTVTATHLNGVLLPPITVSPDANGNCSFTVLPNANKVGSTVITVKVTDADGGQASDTFTLTVSPVNDVPQAGDDAFTVAENATYTADVLANDDVDILSGNGTDTLTLLSIGTTQYGTASVVNNKLYYVPKADRDTTANYTDVFTYTMRDASGATCTPTVTVTVTPVNDPPTISSIADVTGILEDAPDGTGALNFNVTDEEDDDNTLFVSAESDNLTLFPLSNITIDNPTDDATGTLRTVKVVPAANQFGTGTITLTVRDANGATATTSFDVTVNSVNDEPNNGDKSFTVVEDVEKQLDVLSDIDPDYATTPGDYTITAIATNPSHGTVRIAADKKSVYYTTAQDSNEPDSFQYTVFDSYGGKSYTFTASITVTPVNDAPYIVYHGEPSYTIFEGTQQNDIPFEVHDVDNVAFNGGTDPVELTITTKSSNSILLIGGMHVDTLAGYDRNIDLKPYLKWNGSTTVTITVTDPDGLKATKTIDLIVNNVNEAPVAVNDTGTIQEDATSTIDVLVNDTDGDLQTNPDTEKLLVKTVTSTDPNATITRASDGLGVVVVPKANYNGPLSFTYTVEDSQGAESNTATVNLTVQQVNDAPVADNESVTTNEETPVVIDVLEGDSDIDMIAGLNADPNAESISVVLTGGGLTTPAHGAITTDGSKITYTPVLNYNGSDTFEYYCSDGDVKTKASVTVLVYQVNDLPVAVANTATTNEDTPKLGIDVLSNDTDVDTNSTLNQNVLHLRSDFSITAATLTNSAHGTVVITNNKLDFTPATNWFGTEVINYTMSDGHGGTANSTLTMTVVSVNDLPVYTTAPVNLELSEDGADGTMDIVVDDVETGKNDLSVTVTNSLNPTLVATTDVTVTVGTNGTRTITVNPKLDQHGTTTITLLLTDADGGETSKEFTVTVGAVNDTPVAADKTLNINEDVELQTVAKSLLVSDVDVDTNADVLTLSITTAAQHGTAGIDTNGNVTYKPLANFNGTDSFVYTVTDKDGLKDTGTFSINIAQVNDAPVADNDTASTNEDNAVVIDVLDGDTDIDKDDTLNAHPGDESIYIDLTSAGLTAPAHGDVTTDGLTITYTPDTDFNGTDTFEYYCADGDAKMKAEVTVTVNSVNDAPVATDKTLNINEDVALQTFAPSVLVSDVDVDTNADVLTLSITTAAQHGTASIDTNGNVTYKPLSNFNGTDSFVYTVTDKDGLTDTGTFSINIAQVNDAPVADNDTGSTNEDNAVVIDVLDGDTDIDKDGTLNAHPGDESIYIDLMSAGLTAPAHGDVTTDGLTITYTPDANFNGTDTFEYYCADGDAKTKAEVTVTIKQVNDAPVANADTAVTNEDHATDPIDILANDTDIDIGSTLNQDVAHDRSTFEVTAATVTNAAHGSVKVTDNKLVFTPADNWFGEEVIEYTMSDGNGKSATSTVTVTVNSVNDLPVYTTAPVNLELSEDGADGTMDIVVDDVETAKNDLSVTVTNSTNPTLIATMDVTVTVGTNGTRTITVNPKLDQHGTTTITLLLTDADGGETSKEFTVTVGGVNDAPVATDKTLNINEDVALQTFAPSVLVSDVDTATDPEVLTLSITTAAQHGTAGIDTNGNVTYKPLANFNGTDSFVYTVTDKDGLKDTGMFTINIAQVNDAPVADNDAASTNEDNAVVIDVLDGDTDIDKDGTLNAHPGDESIYIDLMSAGLTAPAHGDVTTDGLTITYTPDTDFNGTDTFEYYCADGDAKTKAEVTVTIKQVNDAPIANADSTSTGEDTAVTYDVLGNDTDVDTDEDLNKGELHATSEFSITDCYFYGGTNGTLSYEGGSITYTPAGDFHGKQVIQYVLSDGHGKTSIGNLTVLVGSTNDAPVAKADTMTAEEDHVASINVLTNDTDVDEGDTKTFVGFLEPTSGLSGTFATNAEGDITFTPDANYNGSFDITYQMRDTAGLTSSATITVVITPVNDAPVADDSLVSTDEDTAKEINVDSLIGDVDIDTNADTILVSVVTAGEPAHGGVSVSGTKITYTPDANFNGSDEITYTVTDSKGATDTGKLSITINPVNDKPKAVADEEVTNEDTAKNFYVLTNDSDVDTNAALNKTPASAPYILSVTDGAHGTATTDGAKIVYTPVENYNGTDTITYVLSDGLLSDEASVLITIKQVNDAIHAVNDTAETTDEDKVSINVLTNDWDIDTDTSKNKDALHLRDSFEITEITKPAHGTAKLVSGKIDYTPDDRFAGADSFTYTVSDGHGTTASATVNVNVISVNDAPVIVEVSSPKDGDRAGTGSKVTVNWKGFDIDGDALTYTLEYFDGKVWHEIKNDLTTTTYEFAIPDTLASTDGLKFRVNVRDSEFTSDYGYSGAMKVDKDAPKGTVVTMQTADGRNYTAGVWTNQTVTVVANNAVDASKVTYYYDMDGGTSAAATGMDVVAGVHTVNIKAVDEYGNSTVVGGYIARVDKQQPAVPEIRESVSGSSIVLTLTLQTDPGGSGNDKLTLPDGTTVKATGNPAYAVTKNGTYSFTLTDVAGNRRTFTHTVEAVDTSKPAITLASGAYRTGTTTKDPISATLTFSDADSDIVSRGYQLTQSSTPSGSYRTYDGALKINDPGKYYIHAYAKNAFGLTTYETFGPFILEAPAVAAPETPASPTPVPTSGDVVVTKDDVEEIPGDTVKIRLPGKEWSETLTLEDVGPGTYIIEAMDADGNIRTVEVRVTMRDIFARSIRSAGDGVTTTAIAAIAALAGILFLLLLAGHNITVVVVGANGSTEKKLRTLRRIKMRKKELIIKLDDKHLSGGEFCDLTIAKSLSREMRKNTVIVTMRGVEVLREQIPEDFNEAFKRTIRIEK